MGFWGSEILARSARPLDELDAIASRDEGVDHILRFGDDWQWTQVSGLGIVEDAEAMLKELARETGAPVLTGYVLDGDCIDLLGWAPQSGLWRACLSREAMAGYLAEEGQALDAVFLPPAEAAERAATWAVEAGLSPDRAALIDVFRQEQDAGSVTDLAPALGLRRVIPPAQEFATTTLEARLADFVNGFVAPRLIAAGLERDPAGAYPRDPGVHLFGCRSGRDCVRVGIHPLDPGFLLQLSVDGDGRLDLPAAQGWPLSIIAGVTLGGPPDRLLIRWRRVWRSASGDVIRMLPTSPETAATAADGVRAAVDAMARTARAAGDAEVLIDILHSHGSGNWFWERRVDPATAPEPLMDLAVAGFRPAFALDQALRQAQHWVRDQPPAWMELIDAFHERLRRQGVDPSWTEVGQQVRRRWQELCDGFLTPQLAVRGFVATEHGFELTSPAGDRVLTDLELSATSTPGLIAVYLHTGFLSAAQADWDHEWASRFPRRPTPARRAMFGWFTATPAPPVAFRSDDPALASLGLHPWCFGTDTVADCGRALAAAVLAECDRLEPMLAVDRLVSAISDDEDRAPRLVMALLPHGPSEALTAALLAADAHPDPFVQEMAHWARTRLADLA